MILLIRCNSIKSDPRAEKYIKYYKTNNIEYKIIGWDRLGEELVYENTIYFQRKSLYNQGGFKAAFNRIRWMFFVYRKLIKSRKEISVIHACDLDAAFPSAVYKFFHYREIKIIFDIFDWFTATLYNQNKFILLMFSIMERFSINNSDEVIICEPERIDQIPYKLNKKELILPNIPSFTEVDFLCYNEAYKFENEKIVFSYVGGFAAGRNLDELFDIVEKGLINLLIAGYGEHKLETRCQELAFFPNVKYFGKVDYKVGLNIMYNSDLIYAMYSKSNPNHIYAAPNKYYESMLLGKPILSTKGIFLEKKIVDNNIGYVIDESIEQLQEIVGSLQKKEMLKKGENAHLMWTDGFKNFTDNFLNHNYKAIFKSHFIM